MSKLLEDVAKKFTGRLHGRIRRMKLQKHEPGDRDWIGKLLIFFSLENCREYFETEIVKPAYCRFSLGMPKDEVLKKIREMELLNRGRNFLKKGEKRLSEYLVDFSFSNLTIEQALGTKPMPEGRQKEKFELLMACESESSPTDTEVMKDFMKLIDVKAPIKMMIFQAREGNRRKNLMDKLGKVLQRHSKYERDKAAESQWLFIGNPGYKDWMEQIDSPNALPRQIHILDTTKAKPDFVPCDELWSWDEGPEEDYHADFEE